ncbi:MAG TPA: hypothetical protein DD490_24000, partial [Acidobacteria bacterium]|nr:hypothetical protein [Acidobacteriota bacterium]
MGEMRNSFAGLLDDLAQQLRLPNCIDSLKEEASRLYPIDLLEMDWLGLDMDHAWKYIDDAILGNHLIRRVHVRMLMISPVWDYEPSWLPRETHEWREHSSKRLAAIREWIDDELPQIRATGRELTLEIKLYDQLPVVHGFCVKKPILSWYISFCRWKGAKFRVYDWGENKYWKIKGEPLTPASRD